MKNAHQLIGIDPQDYYRALFSLGINSGDTLYVASSLASVIFVENCVQELVSILTKIVGSKGTLIMPAFSFDFADFGFFDPLTTGTYCGVLSEGFIQMDGVYRSSQTPIHTVAASGLYACDIAHIKTSSSFGRNSVFEWLYQENAVILLLGCSFESGVAHVHWLEERFGVPYRKWVEISGLIMEDGHLTEQSFYRYARINSGIKTSSNQLYKIFKHYIRTTNVGLMEISAFRLSDFARVLFPVFESNRSIMLLAETLPQNRRNVNDTK